jgi:hypothetical protein
VGDGVSLKKRATQGPAVPFDIWKIDNTAAIEYSTFMGRYPNAYRL